MSEKLEKKKKLYYVATTRAVDELYISSTLSYNGKIQTKTTLSID